MAAVAPTQYGVPRHRSRNFVKLKAVRLDTSCIAHYIYLYPSRLLKLITSLREIPLEFPVASIVRSLCTQ